MPYLLVQNLFLVGHPSRNTLLDSFKQDKTRTLGASAHKFDKGSDKVFEGIGYCGIFTVVVRGNQKLINHVVEIVIGSTSG